jgi:4-hydroxy-tetrahydrodipicolinate reductase
MKIALIGYGRMGRAIRPIAEERNHRVVAIDPTTTDADFSEISAESLGGVDVAIEFTTPGVVALNIKKVLDNDVPVVVGTTGWLEKKVELEEYCKEQNGAVLYASNFSLGVNLFSRMVRASAKLMNRVEAYDVSTVEFHHRKKLDSPSGTALALAEVLLKEIDRKTTLITDPLQREIESEELHCASVRCGHVPGTHEILFDSQADSISLKHTARGRNGFALGAVLAAEWIVGRSGFFTIDDFMSELLSE